MKARLSQLILVALLIGMLVACGEVSTDNLNTPTEVISQASPTDLAPIQEPPVPIIENSSIEELSIWDFDYLLYRQPVYISPLNGFAMVSSGTRIRYADSWILNNTNEDIFLEHLELAFVAWDSTGAPLMGVDSLSTVIDNVHVNRVWFSRVAIPAGEHVEFDGGFISRHDPAHLGFGVQSFVDDFDIFYNKAIVVSFRDSNGNEWYNPYFGTFLEAFDGKHFDQDMIIRIG